MDKKKKIVVTIIFAVYILTVLEITLYRTEVKQRLILTPFWEWRQLFTSGNPIHWLLQIGLNILMFVPMGFLLPILSKQFRSILTVTGTAMFLSILIETIQYVAACGFTETDDVMHNTFGSIIGFFLYFVIEKKRYL